MTTQRTRAALQAWMAAQASSEEGLLIELREYGDTLHAARQLPAAYADLIDELTELKRRPESAP